MDMKEITSIMWKISDDKKEVSTFLGTVFGAFSRMEVCEQIIERKKKECPEKADEIHAAFPLCQPTEPLIPLMDLNPKVYSMHVENILDRVIAGEDNDAPTDAEILCVFAIGSQPHPLQHGAAKLYLSIFMKYFPDIFNGDEDFVVGLDRIDQWQADAAYRQIVNWLNVPWRKNRETYDKDQEEYFEKLRKENAERGKATESVKKDN